MRKNIIVFLSLFVAVALFTAPAHAAKQVNDMSEINLIAFIPCAAGGAGELVDLNGPLHTLITFTQRQERERNGSFSAPGYRGYRRNHRRQVSSDGYNNGYLQGLFSKRTVHRSVR
jgi:hypothetical protein